mmetsp:Transcript_8377/g.1127  ORF Transcript_8377/g.1127 Transcript_8377/m.1127 type:complete len:80 (+) Transcript_8377:554-793(+)
MVGCSDNTIYLYSSLTCVFLNKHCYHTEPITCLGSAYQSNWILSGAMDCTIKVWDINQNYLAYTYQNLPSFPTNIKVDR